MHIHAHLIVMLYVCSCVYSYMIAIVIGNLTHLTSTYPTFAINRGSTGTQKLYYIEVAHKYSIVQWIIFTLYEYIEIIRKQLKLERHQVI